MKPVLSFLTALVMAAAAGCSTAHYRKSADKEAYKVISEKTPQVPGMPGSFTVDQGAPVSLEGLPPVTEKKDFLGDAGESEVGASIISLEKALDIAFNNSITYQDQKEALYLDALGLTLDRHRYAPIFSGTASGTYRRSTHDTLNVSGTAAAFQAVPDLMRQAATITGTPGQLLKDYANVVQAAGQVSGLSNATPEIVDERSVTGDVGAGVSLLLAGGAKIALGITSDFLRYLTGDPRVGASSSMTASLTQPLLRGAGRKVAQETLTQSERDTLYQLRSFTRFRQKFAVDIASSYYRVLQNRDIVKNNFARFQTQQRAAARQQAMADAGRLAQASLGRTQQASLEAENSWVASVQSYKASLDRFKIDLGLSTNAKVVLDSAELARLMERGLLQPKISEEDAVGVAMESRLDLYTAKDQFEDAERKITVAKNALKPGLDLVVQGNVRSLPGTQFQKLDFERSTWNAGFDINAPFDRKAERNAYRSALITRDKAQRTLGLAKDNIMLDVRQALRDLDQAKKSFEIRQLGVTLNKRRVEEQDLLFLAGRTTPLDQIDAQNALSDSLNALTTAVVDHTITRLRFWSNMGILFIKENGQWEEVRDDQQPS